MIPLAALFGGYLLAVLLGARLRRLEGPTVTILFLSGVVQLVIVLASMYLMDPPSMRPPGS
jgi:hypothetical protein